jgi:hypothetical protein
MQEIVFTIIVVWVLFRIFGSTSVAHNYTFTQNNYTKTEEKKKEDVKIDFIPPKRDVKDRKDNDDEGEYVDYEEVK